MKNDILTHSGIYFDFVNPTPEMVNIEDVAKDLPKFDEIYNEKGIIF